MKKVLSVIIILTLVLSCATAAISANGTVTESRLPFELAAPGNVTAVWLEGDDYPTTTKITYSLSNEMTAFFKEAEDAHLRDTFGEFIAQYGLDDLWITAQVDWAVDDVDDEVSGWHYNEYWNVDDYYGVGHDNEGRLRVGEWDVVDAWVGNATETVNDLWILPYISEDSFNGNPDEGIPGIKDQMRPEQYTYEYEDEAEDYVLRINFDEHTVYFRMRFIVTGVHDDRENEYFYSDWSNVTSIGKDAEVFEPLTKDDVPAPVITGLRMTDKEFNGNPIVAFTLTVPEELATNAVKLEAFGGRICIETFGRVKGDTEWTELQGDWIVKAGEMEMALGNLVSEERPVIEKDTVIELRCRYWWEQPGIDGTMYSDWSKIISFGTDDIEAGPYARYDLAFEIASAESLNIPTKTIPLNVNIAKNNGYISGWIDLTWDNTALALTSIEYSDIAPRNTAEDDPENPAEPAIENTGTYRIYLGDHITQGRANITGYGSALMLNFEILADAEPGDYPIAAAAAEFVQTDPEADNLRVIVVPGNITLTEYMPLLGDVDFDGKVDIYDVSSIQKSLAGTSGYVKYDSLKSSDYRIRIADVNKDGKIDIFDASLIQKWMAGNTEAQTYGIGKPMKL